MNSSIASTTEALILSQIANGNEWAYTQMVGKYWKKVVLHALSFVKAYPVAEELAQDVFIQIWEKREKLEQIQSFDNYLFIVSRNLIISHIRKKLIETASLKEEKLQELFLKPDEQFELEELNTIILEGANLLTDPRKTIFILSRLEGKDTDYISKELGLAKRTIRWHLLEALNFLRTHMNSQYGWCFWIIFTLSLFFFTK
jgi:RNA polymerase sigma factor (sigma-70 family)